MNVPNQLGNFFIFISNISQALLSITLYSKNNEYNEFKLGKMAFTFLTVR